jgi:hypothetical protein
MDPLDWVRAQGVVLQSAQGPLPNFTERIAGEPIRASWWGHPRGHEIFAAVTRVLDSGEVVATRLVDEESPCSTVGSGRLSCVSPTGFRLSACRHRRGAHSIWCPTGRSRFPSLNGSHPRTSPPPRCSPSTKRSRFFRPASTDLEP